MNDVFERSTQIDGRREPRFNVHWRAGLKLPNGRIIDLRVKDISESGMGLVAAEAVAPSVTLEVRVRVPEPDNPTQAVDVTGTVKVAFVAMRGYDFQIGVTWVDRGDAGRHQMARWMRRMHLQF